MSDRRVDPRTVFFIGAAIACALLYSLTPKEFRWVSVVVVITYLVLAALSLIDHLSVRREARRHRQP